ncbi:MFS family permease [Hamadaea flava]|uniref:MFS transporter n=1 Tax=Hamadaea flava TaxID=1742688 RepID=A0ABV8LRI8_9ACTN|nr:MFS transporter [Hamadaea flava]MCP2327360.1 MFS family permease [Hamadaea flava]
MSPRWSVATIFAVHGSISGSLAARMPWIADHVGLAGGGVGKLGYALVMPSVGAILTMPFAGRVVHRLGGRRATLLLLTGWALALTLISFMPTLPTLAVAMFLAGAFAGTADMAMNAEGIAVERQLGRSIMSSLHGGWSIGGFLAGGVGWLLAHNDVSGRANFIGATLVAIVVAVWACSYLPSQTPVEDEEEDDGAPRFALPKGPILIIGLVGFAAIFAEAASADWSAVYLVNRLGAGDATGAVAYACFAGAMTLGRLTGDAVVRRWGPVPTVRVAGVLGVLGGVLIVIAGVAGDSLGAKIAAIGGFALVGIGIAVVVPLAFAAAGHSAESTATRAHAIAGVATVSYGAGLAAPGIVGGIANLTSLTVSFAVVTVLILVMTLAAPALRSADIVHSREPESVTA